MFHLRYVFRPKDRSEKSYNLLWIKAFKAQGVNPEYINHSYDPNCDVDITTRAIWIVALRHIRDGEELTYNYGYAYDPDSYRDFPCRCGAKHCCGYILAKRYWGLLPKSARASWG